MPPRHNLKQGLQQYPDGTWGLDCYLHGRRVRRKVGTETEARNLLRDLQATARRGELALPPTPYGPRGDSSQGAQPLATTSTARRTLGHICLTHAEHVESPADKLYCKMWARPDFVGRLYPEQLTLEILRKWIKGQLSTGVAVATVHRKIAALRAAWNAGRELELHTDLRNLFANKKLLGLPMIDNEKQVFLNPQQQKALQKALGPRWWPYALFAILTGIRFGNLARMRWEHVDWHHKAVKLPKVKSRPGLNLALSSDALQILKVQLKLKSEYCFPSHNGAQLNKDNFRIRVWRPAMQQAKLPPETRWHDLRHTAASVLANAGQSLYKVQALLGHSDPRMTQRYAHLSEDSLHGAAEDLAKALRPQKNKKPLRPKQEGL